MLLIQDCLIFKQLFQIKEELNLWVYLNKNYKIYYCSKEQKF